MPDFISENPLLQAIGFTDPRSLRVLQPGVDYHSKIFVDFYPFNELFSDLLIPPIYVSSGKLEYQFEHRTSVGRTMGAVVCDDWSVVDQKVSASGIECIFDAWEIEQADINGIKVPLPVGLGSTALLSKHGLNDLADMIRTGIYDEVLNVTPKANTWVNPRWATYWKNRGIFLLDLFLTHLKTNATVFDQDGLPVVSGNIVIETDYTMSGPHPSLGADYQLAFNPIFKALANADGSLAGAVGQGAALLSKSGFNPANDYENQIMKFAYQAVNGIVPQTYLYGKFTSLDFDLSKPFQSTVNFQFDVMNCLRNIRAPEEEEKNVTQTQRRAVKPSPKFSNDLSQHNMV